MSVSIIVATVAAVLLYFVYQKWKDFRRMWSHAKQVPGPKGVPIFGNTLQRIRALKRNTLREERFVDCLKYKHLHRYSGLGKILYFIYNPHDMEIILTNMKVAAKGEQYEILRDWLGTGLLTSNGSKWRYRRKILTPAFHFSILQDFLGIFNKQTDHLVEYFKIHANKPVNVIQPITEFTLSSIGETSLGVEINEEKNSKEYKEAVFDFGELFMERVFRSYLQAPIIKDLHPIVRKSKKVVKTMHDFSQRIIKERKQQFESSGPYSTNKRLALIDILLKAREKEGIKMDDEGIREEVDTFMFGGHDTTAVSLCYTLVVLANEPTIQEEIYQEIIDIMGASKKYPDTKDLTDMTYMERCVKESLRLYPSAPSIARKIIKDVKTHDGYLIPQGAEVQLGIFEMHRMPHLWEDPEKFDPDRFLPENSATRHPFAYIPFSAGARNCIGQKYAMMEIKAALCGVLKAFKLEPVTKRCDLRYKIDIVLRPFGELNVKFVPRT